MVTQFAPLALGWSTLCLAAKPLQPMLQFYEALGFSVVGGNADHGYVMLAHGTTELCLMSFLASNLPTLRGGDIPTLATELGQRGLEPFTLSGMDPTDASAERTSGYRRFDGASWPPEYVMDEAGNPLPAEGSGDFLLQDPDGHLLYFDTVPKERWRCLRGDAFASEGVTGKVADGQPDLGRAVLQLRVQNAQKSLDFYSRLGLVAEVTRPELGYVELATPQSSFRIGLNARSAAEDVLCFSGPDVRSAVERATARGLRFERPLIESEGELRALLRDPGSNLLCLRGS